MTNPTSSRNLGWKGGVMGILILFGFLVELIVFEIIIWLNDHQSNDDFPHIAITGGGKGKFPNLITE